MEDFAGARSEYEIAVLGQRQVGDAVESKPDPPRVGAGCDMEVVAQFALVAVEDCIDTGVDIFVFEYGKVRRSSYPPLRIVATKVRALSWQGILTFDDD